MLSSFMVVNARDAARRSSLPAASPQHTHQPLAVVAQVQLLVEVANCPCRSHTAPGLGRHPERAQSRGQGHAPPSHPVLQSSADQSLVVDVEVLEHLAMVVLAVVEQAVVAQQKEVVLAILYTEVEDWASLMANSL